MKTIERKSDHRRLRGYLARIAGRSPSRFCSPSLIDLRFAVHANAEDTLRIMADLEASGEIIPEVRNVGGETVHGWVVYPATSKAGTPRTATGQAMYTPADCAFLVACGIAPPMDTNGATACAAAL
jgi:hypothetical protein